MASPRVQCAPVIVLCLAGLPVTVPAQTVTKILYVDDNSTCVGSCSCGTCWETAFKYLQDAIGRVALLNLFS